MKSVAIIVLNWNQPQLTIDTISSLKKIEHQDFSVHIIIVDNGSTDNSQLIFKENYCQDKQISLLNISNNTGFTGGNNHGIRYAIDKKFDYILLLNNDTFVDPKFLDILYGTLENDSSIGVVGPKIYFAPGHEFHQQRYSKKELGKVIWAVGGLIDWNNIIFTNRGIDEVDRGQYDKPTSKIDNISGCCALFPANVLKKAGFLDDKLYLYDEDNDLCQRILKLGYKLFCQPQSVIWHLNSGSSKSGGGALHDYFMTRNRLIFGFRYAKINTKFALLRDSVRIYFSGTKWQKIGVVDFYLRRFGKGSWQ